MSVCSPRWAGEWIIEDHAEAILTQLAETMLPKVGSTRGVSLNDGLHFAGGEPFLNYDLLLRLTRMAHRLGLPGLFVESSGFWCREDADTGERMR